MTKKQKAKQYKRVRTLVLNTPIKANSVCYMSFFFYGIVMDTYSCHIYTDALCFYLIIPH